jgi:Lon protease-like protein
MDKLGLFPLGVVLFPESALPLHIFEERYKTLVNDCVEQKLPFGINYISGTKMSNIGCTADVTDVMKKYDDGKLDILVAGTKRFKVSSFTEGEKPYYFADIEYFDDIDEDVNSLLLADTIEVFNTIAERIKAVKIEKLSITGLKTEKPSFKIAQKAGLSLDQRQKLLESKSENVRLDYILKHLRKLLPAVREADTISKIIKNDGYFRPNFFKS